MMTTTRITEADIDITKKIFADSNTAMDMSQATKFDVKFLRQLSKTIFKRLEKIEYVQAANGNNKLKINYQQYINAFANLPNIITDHILQHADEDKALRTIKHGIQLMQYGLARYDLFLVMTLGLGIGNALLKNQLTGKLSKDEQDSIESFYRYLNQASLLTLHREAIVKIDENNTSNKKTGKRKLTLIPSLNCLSWALERSKDLGPFCEKLSQQLTQLKIKKNADIDEVIAVLHKTPDEKLFERRHLEKQLLTARKELIRHWLAQKNESKEQKLSAEARECVTDTNIIVPLKLQDTAARLAAYEKKLESLKIFLEVHQHTISAELKSKCARMVKLFEELVVICRKMIEDNQFISKDRISDQLKSKTTSTPDTSSNEAKNMKRSRSTHTVEQRRSKQIRRRSAPRLSLSFGEPKRRSLTIKPSVVAEAVSKPDQSLRRHKTDHKASATKRVPTASSERPVTSETLKVTRLSMREVEMPGAGASPATRRRYTISGSTSHGAIPVSTSEPHLHSPSMLSEEGNPQPLLPAKLVVKLDPVPVRTKTSEASTRVTPKESRWRSHTYTALDHLLRTHSTPTTQQVVAAVGEPKLKDAHHLRDGKKLTLFKPPVANSANDAKIKDNRTPPVSAAPTVKKRRSSLHRTNQPKNDVLTKPQIPDEIKYAGSAPMLFKEQTLPTKAARRKSCPNDHRGRQVIVKP